QGATIQGTPTITTPGAPFTLVDPGGKTYKYVRGAERQGQSTFRQEVMEAYGFRCALTGESCCEVVEAAHIQPYVNEQSNDVRNGLALRTDIHRLLDAGLITIGNDLRVQVSGRLRSPEYCALAGMTVRLPADERKHPAPSALDFHQRFVFRG